MKNTIASNDYWKQIVYRGVETEYYVSRDGDVWNVRLKSLVSKFKCSSGNYMAVHIFINGVDYKCMIHRLVASAFIPNPENKPQVNHKDTNTFNNRVTNLEWVTALENIQYMIKMGNQSIGVNHKNAKWSEDQIRAVCEMLQNDELPLSDITRQTGVSMKTIQNIRHGKGWKHISRDYHISYNKRVGGPKFDEVSKLIYLLIVNGKQNNEIRDEVRKSGLAESVTAKSLTDRIYHIRKISRLV